MDIVRISRDQTSAILRNDKTYSIVDLSNKEEMSQGLDFASALATNSWRRPTQEELNSFTAEEELLPISTENDEFEYDFNDDYEFYSHVVPETDSVTDSDGVAAFDPETDITYRWIDGEFIDQHEGIDDPEAYLPVDRETAEYIARWVDSPERGEYCDVLEVDPEERELMDQSRDDLDEEFLSMLSAVVADASGYSPVERSRNAKRQRRGPGGRFASGSGGKSGPVDPREKSRAPQLIKTYIPAKTEIIRIDNPLNFISDFLESASPTQTPAVVASGAEPVPEVGEVLQDETRDEPVKTPDTAYFAIVSPDDPRGVQELIAITKSESGAPQAWRRAGGEWEMNPDVLADLQSITPPPVAHLADESLVKQILTEVDAFESKSSKTKDSLVQPEEEQETSIKTAQDLMLAVQNTEEDTTQDHISFIVSRARALNRMDIVPESWREVKRTGLFTESGLVASGKRGNEAALKRYWAFGKGTAKWRPGTPGDLTRLSRALAKYFPQNHWGLAQNIHKLRFGKSNYKRDNG